MTPETGKTLEQLWYENNNHLPMAVTWNRLENDADSRSGKRYHRKRALVLRFNRRWQFVHGWPFIIWPITSVVVQRLASWRNQDGTYNVLGKPFVIESRWPRDCYHRIGSGFYPDSEQEALDVAQSHDHTSLHRLNGVEAAHLAAIAHDRKLNAQEESENWAIPRD